MKGPLSILLFVFWGLNGATGVAESVDLRNMSELADYEVSFCARPSADTVKSLPGHAFVAFSEVTPGELRDFTAIGHTILKEDDLAAAAWSYFGKPVAGFLKPEIYTDAMQTCLRTKVNKGEYQQAKKLTAGPLALLGIKNSSNEVVFQSYKLGTSDCIKFVIDVANVLKAKGLEVPVRAPTDTPALYIAKLIEAN